jgi:diguanylate cyclase
MAELTNPTDIARETLRLLATRRVAPTPDNYRRLYEEIAGVPVAPAPVAALLAALRALPGRPLGDAAAEALRAAADAGDWPGFARRLADELGRPGVPAELGPLLRDLVQQLELPHRGITPARKREGLDRLLTASGSDPRLFDKLRALMRSWAEGGVGGTVEMPDAVAERPGRGGAVPDTARELLVSALENGVAPRLERYPDVHGDVYVLAQRVRDAHQAADWSRLAQQLKQFWMKVELRVEPDNELIDNLFRLFGLVVENLAELVDDEQWVRGQVEVLRELTTGSVDLRTVREAERGFRDLVFKQAMLKASLRDAKATLKSLLSVFVARLGEVTQNTVEYHGKIERYSERISATDSLDSLKAIVDELMADTRGMQVDMLRSRDELLLARQQAEAAERRVHELEGELERVSEQVREDQLTGALNRRGMEDAMTRELSRVQRSGKPLCVAVLDLDNFKRLNDTYGHAAGDAALVHLVKVIKHTVRPTDVIARYGGEEFIVILVDTPAGEAVKVMTRLQRELTKRFFLHNQERLLITFSAGVAQFQPGESEEALLQRADMAMYQAKLQGKNRVVSAN